MRIITLLVLAMLGAPGGRDLPGECDMRSVNFRDNVLWAIAEKDGLDPTTDLLNDQAREYVSSINAWLRRLYDVADFAEWTDIQTFTPDPTTHLILWDAVPSVLDAEGRLDPPKIGKVLKVYLVDPRTTWTPVDTPFRETKQGIYVGFEHGPTVWIKFIPRSPVFTSEVWDSSRTYRKDELTYSPAAGECYKSKANGNRGHDPSDAVNQPLQVEITQELAPDVRGSSAINKILDIDFTDAPLDPSAPTGTVVALRSDTPPVTFLTQDINSAAAGSTPTQIRDGILAVMQADPALSAFTITAISSPYLGIRLQAAMDFSLYPQPYVNAPTYNLRTYLKVKQPQAFSPAVTGVAGDRQFLNVTVSTSEVTAGTTYTLQFIDNLGAIHEVNYVALSTDGAQQIIAGLIAAIQTASLTDAFFTDVFGSIDVSLQSLVISTGQEVSLSALRRPAPSQWWILIPFPFALADQVVRGVYADVLKTEGQADKGMAEEQSVPQETQLRISAGMATGTDMLTDQETARGRYAR